jgi:hypothetical protein
MGILGCPMGYPHCHLVYPKDMVLKSMEHSCCHPVYPRKLF